MRERKYDDAGFTSKERLRERQGLATKELLIELRSLLDSEQSKDSEFRSRYYREALSGVLSLPNLAFPATFLWK